MLTVTTHHHLVMNHLLRSINTISLSVLTLIGIYALYFIFAWLSYKFIFNHDMMRHPKFLPNQVRLEIMTSVRAFPQALRWPRYHPSPLKTGDGDGYDVPACTGS
ncbi:uncharacterized protein ARMOST_06386 [Armillaria ostoyae]|nr:uncharacterized protein ARMOST_06386 [Armillaria ostoyae]